MTKGHNPWQLNGWVHNRPMSDFRPFFDFSQICQKLCMWIAIWLKNIVQYFFRRFVFRIWEIVYANNCVFHCVHKEIDNAFSPGANYSFRESGLQITLHLLNSSSLGNTVLLHTLFLECETRIAIHMHNFWQIWEKLKNGLKCNISWLCTQPFNS